MNKTYNLNVQQDVRSMYGEFMYDVSKDFVYNSLKEKNVEANKLAIVEVIALVFIHRY